VLLAPSRLIGGDISDLILAVFMDEEMSLDRIVDALIDLVLNGISN
jgi:hypothetical protein